MQTFWPVLFVILAVAMAVGPIMMLRPSAGQQRIAIQRAYALKIGLMVSAGEEVLSSGRKAMNYFLPLKEKEQSPHECLLRKQSYVHEAHFYEDWDWAKGSAELGQSAKQREAIIKCIHMLPPGCIALGQNRVGRFIAWSEFDKTRTAEGSVEYIKECLLSLNDAFDTV